MTDLMCTVNAHKQFLVCVYTFVGNSVYELEDIKGIISLCRPSGCVSRADSCGAVL